MNHLRRCVALALLAVLTAALVPGSTRASDPPVAGDFRSELDIQIADLEKKLVSLAEAVPAEKYAWRPGEGVRSMGEVFAHVAQSNYMFPSMLGVKVPEGIGTDLEKKLTKKEEIVPALKKSFEHLRGSVAGLTDVDLTKPVNLFMRESSVLGTYFVATGHLHEHLGQAIAYTRMGGIVPPWTAEREAKQKPE